MKTPKTNPSPKATSPEGKPFRPCPLLIRLSLTQLEIQTLHRALERDYVIGTLTIQGLSAQTIGAAVPNSASRSTRVSSLSKRVITVSICPRNS